MKCLVPHTEKGELLLALNTFQGMRFKEENHMNQLTKMKINFGKESSGISCLCKAIYEWEPQFRSKSHLHSFLKVTATWRGDCSQGKEEQPAPGTA